MFLRNSQEKINCSSKKALQESTLWTRSSHQLLHAAHIRKRWIVNHSHLFLIRDSLAFPLDLQKDSAWGISADMNQAPLPRPSVESGRLLSAHNILHFISTSFTTAVVSEFLLSAFAEQGVNFERLKEMGSKDLQSSIRLSLFLHLYLKYHSKLQLYTFFLSHLLSSSLFNH